MQIDMTSITSIFYIKNNHAFQNNNATNLSHRCLGVQLLNYSIRIKTHIFVLIRIRGNLFYLMEEAANHVKNDMSKIGHEHSKESYPSNGGFLIYVLYKASIYRFKSYVSGNRIPFYLLLLERDKNILSYQAFISSLKVLSCLTR